MLLYNNIMEIPPSKTIVNKPVPLNNCLKSQSLFSHFFILIFLFYRIITRSLNYFPARVAVFKIYNWFNSFVGFRLVILKQRTLKKIFSFVNHCCVKGRNRNAIFFCVNWQNFYSPTSSVENLTCAYITDIRIVWFDCF